MTSRVEWVSPDATVEEAAQKMRRMDVGALPVCEHGHLVGMLTDRDIVVRAVSAGYDLARLQVGEIASRDLLVGHPDQHPEEVARLMKARGVRRVPVVDEDRKLIGILTVEDLAARGDKPELAARVVSASSPSSQHPEAGAEEHSVRGPGPMAGRGRAFGSELASESVSGSSSGSATEKEEGGTMAQQRQQGMGDNERYGRGTDRDDERRGERGGMRHEMSGRDYDVGQGSERDYQGQRMGRESVGQGGHWGRDYDVAGSSGYGQQTQWGQQGQQGRGYGQESRGGYGGGWGGGDEGWQGRDYEQRGSWQGRGHEGRGMGGGYEGRGMGGGYEGRGMGGGQFGGGSSYGGYGGGQEGRFGGGMGGGQLGGGHEGRFGGGMGGGQFGGGYGGGHEGRFGGGQFGGGSSYGGYGGGQEGRFGGGMGGGGHEGRFGGQEQGWGQGGQQGWGQQGGQQGWGQQGGQQGWGQQGGQQGWGQQGGQFGGMTQQRMGRGPKGYKRSDERIREDICDRLSDHPLVDSSEIEVKVQNGEVILSGTITERRHKHLIEQLAESISGVQDVRNEIRVKRAGQETQETRGTGTTTGTTTGGTETRQETTTSRRTAS